MAQVAANRVHSWDFVYTKRVFWGKLAGSCRDTAVLFSSRAASERAGVLYRPAGGPCQASPFWFLGFLHNPRSLFTPGPVLLSGARHDQNSLGGSCGLQVGHEHGRLERTQAEVTVVCVCFGCSSVGDGLVSPPCYRWDPLISKSGWTQSFLHRVKK